MVVFLLFKLCKVKLVLMLRALQQYDFLLLSCVLTVVSCSIQ